MSKHHPASSDQTQRTRFFEAARELGADDDEATFKAKLGVIARQKVNGEPEPVSQNEVESRQPK